MRAAALEQLREPAGGSRLRLRRVAAEEHGEVREGELEGASGRAYPVRNFIPRFAGEDSYAASFGEQWNIYRRTQIDRFNGTTLSRDRFFRDTRWTPEELRGQRVLEVGCGAGRFTQVLLDAGAEVFSLDYSSAVDACWQNNGPHPRLTLAQGDLYELPFARAAFDKVFCFGVIQHTPDVKRAFMSLVPFVRPGGKIAVDVYPKTRWVTRWTAKYWYRPLTKRLPRPLLRRIIEWYVPRWIPIDNRLQSVRVLRYVVPAVVPCWNYTGMLPLDEEQIRQWAILDTFDALSPAYDSPQDAPTLRAWFEEAGLEEVDVRAGGNGFIGTATAKG
ncbi:MAG TPA: class I SAM-dependent methyltransferase [Pyrinomonadaceae bacterium]|nr:class I SAM-dependent methyltransferase [Pyrinomonadaceae bacterium]